MQNAALVVLLLVPSLWSQEQITWSASAPPAPSSVGASANGARGGATLYYWVIARYPGGASSATMAMAFSTVGAGNLTISDFVRVSWAPSAGATGYDVLRSDTPAFPGPSCAACAVVLNTASTSVDDTGGALSAYPPGGLNSAVPVTASLTINNRDATLPYVNLQLLSIRLNEVLRVGLISGTPAENDCIKYSGGRLVTAGAACGSGGGGGASASSELTDCKVSYASGSVVNIGACAYRVGENSLPSVAACSTSAAPTGSGTLLIYGSADGTYTLGYSGTATVACTGWTVATNVVGFPDDSLPFATATWISGAWQNTVVDQRRFVGRDVVVAGQDLDQVIVDGVKTITPSSAIPRAGQVQSGTLMRCASTSVASPYLCTMNPTLTGYTDGMVLEFEATAAALSGAVDLNIDGQGNRAIKRCDASTNPASGDIAIGRQVSLTYDGTVFRLPCNPAPVTSGASIPAPVAWASNPTCSTTAYIQTFIDALYTKVCDGASNATYFYQGRKVNLPPSAASWTNVGNGGSGMVAPADSAGSVVWELTGSSSTQDAAMLTALPGGDYSITIVAEVMEYIVTAVTGPTYCGFGVTGGTATTNAIHALAYGFSSAPRIFALESTDFNRSGASNVGFWSDGRPIRFYRLSRTGTTLTLSMSMDGRVWNQLDTSTAFTATHYGAFCHSESANTRAKITLISVEQ